MENLSLLKEEAIEDFESLLHSTLSNDLSSEIEGIIRATKKYQISNSNDGSLSERNPRILNVELPLLGPQKSPFRPSASLPPRLDATYESPRRNYDGEVRPSRSMESLDTSFGESRK
ncbi:hypothetical protein HDU67_005768, partial [Dinochytrium kinnereticum]